MTGHTPSAFTFRGSIALVLAPVYASSNAPFRAIRSLLSLLLVGVGIGHSGMHSSVQRHMAMKLGLYSVGQPGGARGADEAVLYPCFAKRLSARENGANGSVVSHRERDDVLWRNCRPSESHHAAALGIERRVRVGQPSDIRFDVAGQDHEGCDYRCVHFGYPVTATESNRRLRHALRRRWQLYSEFPDDCGQLRDRAERHGHHGGNPSTAAPKLASRSATRHSC